MTGVGKAARYFEALKPLYQEYIGMDFFCGTLNVLVDNELLITEDAIYVPSDGIGIALQEQGIQSAEKGCYFVPAKLFGESVYICRPEKTEHPNNLLEIISANKIKDKYNLNIGDEVEIITND